MHAITISQHKLAVTVLSLFCSIIIIIILFFSKQNPIKKKEKEKTESEAEEEEEESKKGRKLKRKKLRCRTSFLTESNHTPPPRNSQPPRRRSIRRRFFNRREKGARALNSLAICFPILHRGELVAGVAVIGHDGFSGAVRVVPAAHTASHAGLRGFGAAGVAFAVPRPRRRDLRLAAHGGRG